jgi:hypothetical protein
MRRVTGRWGGGGRQGGVVLALAVSAALLGVVPPARADILQDLGVSYQKVAEQLVAAFPKAEVQVTAVTTDGVRIEGAGVENLRPGLELTIFRRGEMFRHPVTNQPLGHTEQVLGTLVVTRVEPGAAIGRLVPPAGRAAPAPAPGDGARITAGRMPVAVLPTAGVQAAFDSADQTRLLLVARFSAILDKTGRFLSTDAQRVLDVVDQPTGSTPSALEVARRLGGVGVLTSRVIREGTARVLEASWISGQTGETLASLRAPVTPSSFPPRFAWEETPELERKFPLEGPVRALALGDLDGDGLAELVVADEQNVMIYRTPEGGTPSAVENATFRTDGLVLSVDAAPITDTGRTQLVVVEQRGEGRQGIRARVLEWNPSSGYRVLHDTTGHFLRVVRVGAEDWLLEQDVGEGELFEIEIRRLLWDGERFRETARLKVPRGVSIYGLALMRLTGNPEPEVVAFTDDYRLTVWTARGQRLWTSSDPLGGSAVTFEYLPQGAARRQAGSDTNVARIAGRVVPLAMAAPSQEILVYENILPALQQGRGVLPRLAATLFNRGRIHRLRWKDGAFVRVWQSNVTEGYIADFAYGDLDGDGLAEVVVGVVPRGFDLETLSPLGRPRGRILAYELP